MNFTEEKLIELYVGLTPDSGGLNTTGGIMTRTGGFSDYQKCVDWLEKNVSKDDGFIEIGSAWGGSFHMWATTISNGPKISVDYLDTLNYPFFTNISFSKRHALWESRFNNVHSVHGKSQDDITVDKVNSILNGKQVGWLYIDGDHFYPNFITDYEKYKQFVKPGGFIGFHDVADYITAEGVREVGSFFNTLPNRVFQSTDGDGIGIIQI